MTGSKVFASRLGSWERGAVLVAVCGSLTLLTGPSILFAHDAPDLGTAHSPTESSSLLEQARAAKRTASSHQSDGALSKAAENWELAGHTYEQAGSFHDAALAWTEAASLYEQQNEPTRQVQAVIHLGYALQQIGQYRNAVESLEAAREIAKSQDETRLLVATLGQLGRVYAALGNGQANESFEEALRLAGEADDVPLVAILKNDHGNALGAQGNSPDALKAFEESARLARDSGQVELSATALINAAMAALDLGLDSYAKNAKDHMELAYRQLDGLSDTHAKAFGLLNLALGYDDLYQRTKPEQHMWPQFRAREERLLKEAAALATRIGDRTTESYALGYLGQLHEQAKQFPEALDLSRRAAFAAQQATAPESLYRWHWQIGRILAATDKPDEAIQAYQLAVDTVQPIRQEFSGYRGRRHSFRESVAPVFYEMADLLLKHAQNQDRLIQARNISEQYKAAELHDYFKDDCVKLARSQATATEKIPKTAAIIYPIILPDRLELLLSIGDTWKRAVSLVTADRLTSEVRGFRKKLQDPTNDDYLAFSRQLYQWIVTPLEQDLAAAKIDTLVFVPDGPLRTIPMAALHDGKQFLIHRFAVAVTPGMELTDLRPIDRSSILMLSLGISVAVQGESPLPHVRPELDSVKAIYGGTSLIDQEFQVPILRAELQGNPYSIVHIASHGKMERDFESSYLLAYDGKITMVQLSQLIGMFRFRKTALDLLTLSACETAIGDDRAALGLAGVAVKAGARSALASLWLIDDEATSHLVREFYTQLQNPKMSKAAALQQAQLKILGEPHHDHPSYWAPFLLINNWL